VAKIARTAVFAGSQDAVLKGLRSVKRLPIIEVLPIDWTVFDTNLIKFFFPGSDHMHIITRYLIEARAAQRSGAEQFIYPCDMR